MPGLIKGGIRSELNIVQNIGLFFYKDEEKGENVTFIPFYSGDTNLNCLVLGTSLKPLKAVTLGPGERING